MRFEFATANRIIFGAGTLREVGKIAASLGYRTFVVTGKDTTRADPLLDLLDAHEVEAVSFAVNGEPTTHVLEQAVAQAKEYECDLVIGIGGGSVIDTGKAVAALLTNGGNLMDYLEVIGKAEPLTQAPAPYIAIPTTAGTGAEVTRNAVLGSPEHGVKASLRSPLMLPRVAVVDPELTYAMPPTVTATTGMDALTQLIEPCVSSRANPLTDVLCRDGIIRAARSLRRAYQDGRDGAAREDMALASLYGGLALANAGLGAVHGFAGPMGGMYPAPHGALCARLLPFVMEANIRALQARQPDSPTLLRYQEIAGLLTARTNAAVEEGVEWVHQLCNMLDIAPLATYGATPDDTPAIIPRARAASSMQANPLPLTDSEMEYILNQAL